MEDSNIIKYLRKGLGYSQTGFAKILGTTQQTLTLVEHGRREIPKSLIKNLREAIGVDYYDLYHCQNESDIYKLIKTKENKSSLKTNKEYKVNISGTVVGESKQSILKNLCQNHHNIEIDKIEIEEIK